MPELPEVECLTRAVKTVANNTTIISTKFYRKDLREPIPIREFNSLLRGQKITDVSRRSKYMLIHCNKGIGIFHLGMTGNILCYDTHKPQLPHTHAVFEIKDSHNKTTYLHFVDPRRFGYIQCCKPQELNGHRYFKHLGPEPLGRTNLAAHLFKISRNRKGPVKNFLMNAQMVVGVGNIYASESLFRAKIHPLSPAGSVTKAQYEDLATEVKQTLKEAIKAGGTTLRDFKNPEGKPGYFSISLKVYGRKNQACRKCDTQIEEFKLAGRATYFCPVCQKHPKK